MVAERFRMHSDLKTEAQKNAEFISGRFRLAWRVEVWGLGSMVADKDNLFQSVLALQLRDLLRYRGGVLSVTGKNFDSDRTTLRAAQ
jgi:hypothetical protein